MYFCSFFSKYIFKIQTFEEEKEQIKISNIHECGENERVPLSGKYHRSINQLKKYDLNKKKARGIILINIIVYIYFCSISSF